MVKTNKKYEQHMNVYIISLFKGVTCNKFFFSLRYKPFQFNFVFHWKSNILTTPYNGLYLIILRWVKKLKFAKYISNEYL